MNKLMMMLTHGCMPCYMAEAGETGGGETKTGGGETKTGEGETKTGEGETKTGEGETKTGEGETKTGEGETKTGEGETKTGEGETKSAIALKALKTGEGETKTGEGEKKTDFTDEDFTKAMVASDEVKKAAGDDKLELSPELVKGMLPAIRKCGISPEQANELANSLAMQQVAAAKAHAEARAADIKKMNDEATRIYPDKQSWDAIGAGVKHFFKPGGTMYETIVHSELGCDPEFLALMKWAGERVAKDNTPTGAGAGGEKTVSYEKALGIG